MERSKLVPDRLYFVTDAQCYFVSPDGVGGFWFDTRAEVEEAYGKGTFDRLYVIEHLEDF